MIHTEMNKLYMKVRLVAKLIKGKCPNIDDE